MPPVVAFVVLYLAVSVTTAIIIVVAASVTLTAIIASIVCEECKEFVLDTLGWVMGLFGIKAEDVVETQVFDQRLITDDEYIKSLMTRIALEHQDTQMGIIELMSIHTEKTRSQLNRYYTYGDDSYSHGLPETNMTVPYVPQVLVTPIIISEFGGTPIYISDRVGQPDKIIWADYILYKLYNYQPWNYRLIYTGLVYEVKIIDYNYTTNKYDVNIFRPGTEVTEVTVTIIPYDATQDTKRTNTKVSRVLTEETTVLSDTTVDVLVPKGSEEPSYESTSVAIEYDPITISIDVYKPVKSMIVKFHLGNPLEYYHWVYQIGDGNEDLDNTNQYVTNLGLLPIVELRNSKVNVNSDKTSVGYLESKQILEYIGLDVDTLIDTISENPSIDNIEDAYVYFGMELAAGATDPLIAKMLYIMWEYLYYDSALVTEDSAGYSVTIREGSYNSTIVWHTQTRTIVDGIIGVIGTYQVQMGNEAGTTYVKFAKQETEEQYVEYKITSLVAAIFIDRGTHWGMVTRDINTDGGVVIPLSKHFIEALTPIEQMEAFTKCLRMSIYSISVTHLDWYETPAFLSLMQIIITIVVVVLTVVSFGADGGGWAALGKSLLWMLGGMAFVKLLEYVDNPWLKALLIVVAAVVLYQTGQVTDPNQLGFMTADMLTTAVTQFTEMKMEELQGQMSEYYETVKEALEKLKDATESVADYISTEFVAKLSNLETSTAFIEGPDLTYYKAIDMQHNWDLVKGGIAYQNAFDYDHFYRLGVV